MLDMLVAFSMLTSFEVMCCLEYMAELSTMEDGVLVGSIGSEKSQLSKLVVGTQLWYSALDFGITYDMQGMVIAFSDSTPHATPFDMEDLEELDTAVTFVLSFGTTLFSIPFLVSSSVSCFLNFLCR